MGIKRIVDTSFWTDDKVIELFSPEDKLFMLYLMTNPHTTQLGIYSLNKKIMAFELGYSIDAVSVLIDRFETKYDIIRFSKETNEIALKNSLRHNIVKGGAPVRDCLIKELKAVKNKELISFVFSHIKHSENINETVKNIIAEYEELYDDILYCSEKRKSTKKKSNNNDNENVNDNDNDNDNDVSYHVSYHDSLNEFETLWKLYPRKIGKTKALKAYQKARKQGITYEQVEQGILNYCKQIEAKQTSAQYIKHGSSWFNSEGWLDEYDFSSNEKQHNASTSTGNIFLDMYNERNQKGMFE